MRKRERQSERSSQKALKALYEPAVWSPGQLPWTLDPGQRSVDCGQSLSKSRPLKSIKLNGFGRCRTMTTIDVP